MSEPSTVLLASANASAIDRISNLLDREPDFRISTRQLVANGTGAANPLAGLKAMPELLVMIVGPNWETELAAVQSGSGQPPLVVIAPEGDMGSMRRAMQLGARDFLGINVDKTDLLKSLRVIAAEEHRKRAGARAPGKIIAVINAKGGSGASFVAGSIATALAPMPDRRVSLFDMDLQFGVQSLALDVKPRANLLDALGLGAQLDGVALEGFMTPHASGLRLLGQYGGELALPWTLPREDLQRLLNVATTAYDPVIVDLPRQIDPLTTTVLDSADQILIVMHQTLPHIRDAQSLIRIITRELQIPASRIKVVVNRYQAESPVTLDDIRRAVDAELLLVPNDYKRVSEAMNHGVPVLKSNPAAAVSKALAGIAVGLVGTVESKARAATGGLRGKFAGLFGTSTERKP